MPVPHPPADFSLHPDRYTHLFIDSDHAHMISKNFTPPGWGAKAPHTPQLRPLAAGGALPPWTPPSLRADVMPDTFT